MSSIKRHLSFHRPDLDSERAEPHSISLFLFNTVALSLRKEVCQITLRWYVFICPSVCRCNPPPPPETWFLVRLHNFRKKKKKNIFLDCSQKSLTLPPTNFPQAFFFFLSFFLVFRFFFLEDFVTFWADLTKRP